MMKLTMLKSKRGFIFEDKNVNAFLKEIVDYYAVNEKVETNSTLSKLVLMRYNEKGSIHEHILEMSNLVTRLRALKLQMSNDVLMHMILISLPI